MGRVIKPLENKPHIVNLRDFPDYEITKDGEVFKKATGDGKQPKGRYKLKPFGHYRSNSLRVILYRDGKKHTRGVADLMLQSFFPDPRPKTSREVFFIDKNEHNVKIENMKVADF